MPPNNCRFTDDDAYALTGRSAFVLGLILNNHSPTMPPGTLAANLIGGYVIGLAVAFFASLSGLAPEWRLFVITGFCGGLMTLAGIGTVALVRS